MNEHPLIPLPAKIHYNSLVLCLLQEVQGPVQVRSQPGLNLHRADSIGLMAFRKSPFRVSTVIAGSTT